MATPVPLNAIATHVAAVLRDACPDESFATAVRDGGCLEAWLPAPPGSRAGALVVSTTPTGDTWVRFAPPHAFYGVDSDDELIRVVRALLSESALFVVIFDGAAWAGTTLIDAGTAVDLDAGQHATVISWTGQRDSRVIRPRARVSRPTGASAAATRRRPAVRRRP